MPRCASCQLFRKGLLSGPALTIISANVKGPSAVKQEIIIQLCDKCNCQVLGLQAKHEGINNSYHQDNKNEPDQRKKTCEQNSRVIVKPDPVVIAAPIADREHQESPRSVGGISVTSVYTFSDRMVNCDCGKM